MIVLAENSLTCMSLNNNDFTARYNNNAKIIMNIRGNENVNAASELLRLSDSFVWNHQDAVIINTAVCDNQQEEYEHTVDLLYRNSLRQHYYGSAKNDIMVCESLLSTHEPHATTVLGNSNVANSMPSTDSSNIQESKTVKGNHEDDLSKHSGRSKCAVEVASAAALVTQYLTSKMYHGGK